MIAGPVCHYELLRLSRRRRFYMLRLLFGTILLAIVGFNYLTLRNPFAGWQIWSREFSINEMSRFSRGLFGSMIAAQAALVFGLTPALVADAISSERQRKTLHYLLSSQLGGEIVVGKLAARLLNVGVFLSLVLPIISLLTLFGGVDPEELLWCYAGLASSAFFLAGMAILISVEARRPRDAVGGAYAAMAFWLFLVPGLGVVVGEFPEFSRRVSPVLEWIGRWVWPATPLAILGNLDAVFRGGPGAMRQEIAWMIASQGVYGLLLVALAAWRLRGSFRRIEGKSGPRTRRAQRWRLWPGRPCGDDPIYWREVYVARSRGGLLQGLVRLSVPVLLALGIAWAFDESLDAFKELRVQGYGAVEYAAYTQREGLNLGLRFGGTFLFAFWMLWLARITAAGIASEREQDTWISLLATPLEGREILLGKIRGALRATRAFGVSIAALWLIGLASGAVHPLGLLIALSMLVLFTWYTTALGMFFSLRSATSWRAQALTLGVLIGPHLCCWFPSPLIFFGYPLLSYSELHSLMKIDWSANNLNWVFGAITVYIGFGLVLYTGGAYFLTRWIFRGFDRVVDRPRRLAERGFHRRPKVEGGGVPKVKDAPSSDD